MKRIVYIVLGGIMFGLGTIGILLPILPTTPFYIATAFFWLNSSEKLHNYFIQTEWYKKYVKEMMIERKMTQKQKYKVLGIIFLLLAIPFILVPNLIMRICLIGVFVGHCIFFHFYFKKKNSKSKSKVSTVE